MSIDVPEDAVLDAVFFDRRAQHPSFISSHK